MAIKIEKIFKKTRRKFTEYISTNRLFLSFVFLLIIETALVRYFTIGNIWSIKPFIMDLALILIIGSLGYLFKPKRQFSYFFTALVILTAVTVINSIYYTFYLTFTSFGLLASASQVGGVMDSFVEKLTLLDFIYLLGPIIFFYIHRMLYKTNYYNYVAKVEKGQKMCVATSLVGAILVAFTMVTMTGTDYSRLGNQWNREYIVERFGIVMYQGNDLFQSLTLKVNSLFGYDTAAQEYREFYEELSDEHRPNKYTDLLKGKNIIFVHMESIQTFLMDLEFNGVEVTPNINRLAAEGMFFSNFYPQISTGTSSDTEFTLLTSLMPALSGTVFMSYNNRQYVSIPKLLKESDYYTFSMHGNKAGMWGRDKMHPNLGYDDFFSSTSFTTTEENKVGRLGIGDSAFFLQAMPMLEDIDTNKNNYMGTIITLSNHSPFDSLDKYGEFDLSYAAWRINEKTKLTEQVIDPYLNERKIGDYFKSSHYADNAIGEFIEYIKESENFSDTVFIFYGDHDAKLSRKEFDYLKNYDPETGILKVEEDPDYIDYDIFKYDLDKNTPLIFWTKDQSLLKKLQANVDYYMGMYDILPTLGNMMGFSSPYALGHDIFDAKEGNIVIFPNGNFLTQNAYYSNSAARFIPLSGIPMEPEYIAMGIKYTTDRLKVSNSIIVYDLIRKESNKANYSEIEVSK